MPGINLTRDEAAERARLLDVSTYDVVARPDHLGVHLRVDDDDPLQLPRSRARPRSPTCVGGDVHEITLNGSAAGPDGVRATAGSPCTTCRRRTC